VIDREDRSFQCDIREVYGRTLGLVYKNNKKVYERYYFANECAFERALLALQGMVRIGQQVG